MKGSSDFKLFPTTSLIRCKGWWDVTLSTTINFTRIFLTFGEDERRYLWTELRKSEISLLDTLLFV